MHHISSLSSDDLLAYFRQGEKPRTQWRVGSEHELFVLDAETLERLPYERIRNILESIQKTGDWTPVVENGFLIGLSQGASSISLEPGGQLELSTAPHATLHTMVEEIEVYHQVLRDIQAQHGCVFVALGLDPFSTLATIPWMPKERYQIMRSYMPARGALGLDMMGNTATVQVNLDYSSEEDMGHKLHVALAVQPFINAFFVASPVREKQDSGWDSFRQHIWTDTDPDRSGTPASLFQPSVRYADYRDYALDVPMYFIKRDHHIPATAWTFSECLQGCGSDEHTMTMQDWGNHLGTLFPDVRLKQYLEMRGADSVPPPLMYGLAAFWVGLLYDEQNMRHLVDQTRDWTHNEVITLRDQVAQQGWHDTSFRGRAVQEWCRELLQYAHAGLERRALLKNQQSESIYLGVLGSMVLSGETVADSLRQDIHFMHINDYKCEFLKSSMI